MDNRGKTMYNEKLYIDNQSLQSYETIYEKHCSKASNLSHWEIKRVQWAKKDK